jgi:hypothetical protein
LVLAGKRLDATLREELLCALMSCLVHVHLPTVPASEGGRTIPFRASRPR